MCAPLTPPPKKKREIKCSNYIIIKYMLTPKFACSLLVTSKRKTSVQADNLIELVADL